MAFIVFLAGGFSALQVWHDAKWENNGLHGYHKSDALDRARSAGWGFFFLFWAVFFATSTIESEDRFERIVGATAAIIAGLLSLAFVHASLPHNRDGEGFLITTQILPPWVKLLTDVLGLASIASSALAIISAKEE